MKKLFIVLISLAFSSVAYAQIDTESVSASATIQAGLAVTKDADLAFGTLAISGSVVNGSTIFMNPNGSVAPAIAGGGSLSSSGHTFGLVTITGAPSGDVQVTITNAADVELENIGNSTTINLELATFIVGAASSLTAANLAAGTTSVTLNGSGTEQLRFGGTLSNFYDAGLKTGVHSGTFTVEVDYN